MGSNTSPQYWSKYIYIFINHHRWKHIRKMIAMTFSRVESYSPSASCLLSSSSHHFEYLSALACRFVSGWLQLQDILYGQCFWALWIPVIMGEALAVQWTFVVRDVRTHTRAHTHKLFPTPWVIELIMFWALLSPGLGSHEHASGGTLVHAYRHARSLAHARIGTAHHPFSTHTGSSVMTEKEGMGGGVGVNPRSKSNAVRKKILDCMYSDPCTGRDNRTNTHPDMHTMFLLMWILTVQQHLGALQWNGLQMMTKDQCCFREPSSNVCSVVLFLWSLRQPKHQ